MNNTQTNNNQVIEADVFLGNVSRKVALTRLEGQSVYWSEYPVICRFRSGSKTHTKNWPMVVQRAGRLEVALRQVVANKNAMAIAWADETAATSNWSREGINRG